jgi:hypothetical protein
MITFNDNSEKIPYEKSPIFLDIVSPDNDFLANLQALISQGGPLLSLKDMGFHDNWKHLGVWK